MAIDFTTELGQRASGLLDTAQVIRLITVGTAGRPTPSIVWFLRENTDTIVLFSEPQATKVRHIGENPKVALTFNSDDHGSTMTVINGIAELLPEPTAEVLSEAYTTKYAEGIASLGITTEQMASQYSQAIRISLNSLRGH